LSRAVFLLSQRGFAQSSNLPFQKGEEKKELYYENTRTRSSWTKWGQWAASKHDPPKRLPLVAHAMCVSKIPYLGSGTIWEKGKLVINSLPNPLAMSLLSQAFK
jgi:hypothetical protein